MTASTGIIKTVSSDPKAYSNDFINVTLDKVQFPNGTEGEYSVISNAGKKGAVIVPLAVRRGIGYFGPVNQYRYPLKGFTLEFPRGGSDDLEEEGAQLEITEELGQDAQRLIKIGAIHPDTGILSTQVGVWIALMDESVLDTRHVEGITGLTPAWSQEAEFDGKIIRGEITCGITLAAYTLFKLNRNKFGALLDAPF